MASAFEENAIGVKEEANRNKIYDEGNADYFPAVVDEKLPVVTYKDLCKSWCEKSFGDGYRG